MHAVGLNCSAFKEARGEHGEWVELGCVFLLTGRRMTVLLTLDPEGVFFFTTQVGCNQNKV